MVLILEEFRMLEEFLLPEEFRMLEAFLLPQEFVCLRRSVCLRSSADCQDKLFKCISCS